MEWWTKVRREVSREAYGEEGSDEAYGDGYTAFLPSAAPLPAVAMTPSMRAEPEGVDVDTNDRWLPVPSTLSLTLPLPLPYPTPTSSPSPYPPPTPYIYTLYIYYSIIYKR